MDGLLSSLVAPSSALPVSEFLFRLLVAWLLGQVVGWFYGRSHGALSYSQSFVQALVLLSMVICLIMAVVGDSLVRAFGLGAALTIVRFRTPVKDARDTTFLFLAVAVGMATGAGMVGVAVVSALVIGLASLQLHATAYGTRSVAEGTLQLNHTGEGGRGGIAQILLRHCRSFQLSAARRAHADSPEQLVYEINLRSTDAGERLMRELMETGEVSGISLLPHARIGES